LSAVKGWVLSKSPSIQWESFSSSLKAAPLAEEVVVCVLSKVDGGSFRQPPGIKAPAPESVVGIVRRDGDSTLFLMGSTVAMLEATPKSFSKTS
jgi:hypothetical protein